MAQITTALIIVLSINMLFFLGQMAIEDISEKNDLGNPTTLLNCEGSIYSYADVQGCSDTDDLMIDSEGVQGKLPTGEGSVSPTTGNLFTDAWSSIKNWFLQATGLGYLLGIVSAVPNFLASLGLPQAFVFGVGALWYLLGIFLVVSFLAGGR